MTPGTTIATAEETARAQAAPAAPAAAAQEDERVKRFREGMRMAIGLITDQALRLLLNWARFSAGKWTKIKL